MLIAIIILSVLFLCSIFINIIFFLGFKKMYEMTFGTTEPMKIIQQFEDVTLIVSYITAKAWAQAVDMSQYEEKKTIGLTVFAQEKEFLEIAEEITGSREESEGIIEMLKQGFVVPHANLYQLEEGLWIWNVS